MRAIPDTPPPYPQLSGPPPYSVCPQLQDIRESRPPTRSAATILRAVFAWRAQRSSRQLPVSYPPCFMEGTQEPPFVYRCNPAKTGNS